MALNLQDEKRYPCTHTVGHDQPCQNTPFWLHDSKTSPKLHHSQQKQPSARAGKGQVPVRMPKQSFSPLSRVKNRKVLG